MPLVRFREAMSRFACGVTVVAGRIDGELHGMTVAAFSSVSAEPPIVLVCLSLGSHLGDALREGDPVTVSILPATGARIARRFAGLDGYDGGRYDGIETEPTATSVPLLAGSVAGFVTRVRLVSPGGDHRVFLLDVLEVRLPEIGEGAGGRVTDPAPLLWWSRGFARVEKV